MTDLDREHTGTLEIADGVLRNRSTWFGDWELPISRLRLVGEATDENGPCTDDWYIVFAEDDQGWFSASAYAPGVLETLRALGDALGSGVGPLMLANSATFASRVLWPPPLVGRPVFNYTQDGPRNWLERAVYPLIKPSRNVQRFTGEVLPFLRTGRPDGRASSPPACG